MSSTKDRPSRSPRHAPDEARRLIVEGAVRFLSARPYREMTVGDLMDGTPLSRPAFYRYFDDLPRLILALLDEVEAAVRRTPNPWLQGRGEPVAALRESLAELVRTLAVRGPVLRAIAEAAPSDPGLAEAWDRFLGRWDRGVGVRLRAEQLGGRVAGFEPGPLAFALNRLVVAVLIAEFGGAAAGDPARVAATLQRIWVGAIYGGPVRGAVP
jgi:AcrR family transcriptional regulator